MSIVDSKGFLCQSEGRKKRKTVSSAFISSAVHLLLNISMSSYSLSMVLQRFLSL